jgi:hypothetical protein
MLIFLPAEPETVASLDHRIKEEVELTHIEVRARRGLLQGENVRSDVVDHQNRFENSDRGPLPYVVELFKRVVEDKSYKR